MRRQTLWIAIAVAVLAVSFGAQAQDHAYAGAAKCKMCHKVQYASWEQTSHAKATDAAKTVVGVDVSSRLLLQAKEHARKFRNVNLVQADADHLPFISNYFNVVFAFTVLQNMPNPQETLSEIRRNATFDASVVVTGLKKAFPLEIFRRLLLDAGFRVVSLEDADPLKCYVAVTVQKQTSAFF